MAKQSENIGNEKKIKSEILSLDRELLSVRNKIQELEEKGLKNSKEYESLREKELKDQRKLRDTEKELEKLRDRKLEQEQQLKDFTVDHIKAMSDQKALMDSQSKTTKDILANNDFSAKLNDDILNKIENKRITNIMTTPDNIFVLLLSNFKILAGQEKEKGFREAPIKTSRFFRKGKVGGWRKELTETQIKKIIDNQVNESVQLNEQTDERDKLKSVQEFLNARLKTIPNFKYFFSCSENARENLYIKLICSLSTTSLFVYLSADISI
jgi:hypothetical protein